MTLKELLYEVTSLGFAEYAKESDALVYAANRAARCIFADLPTTRSVKLYAKGQAPRTHIKSVIHKGGSTVCLPLSGRAYSMRLVGKGRYTVTDEGGEQVFDFDACGEVFSGFLFGEGEIVFSGDFCYTVYDLVTYSDIYSDKESDIPDGSEAVRFDMRNIFADFQSFASSAKDRDGKIIEGSVLFDGILELPSSYAGEINIAYNRLPRKIYAESRDTDIDIPEERAPLLPLLTVYYLLLEDDAQIAEIYLSRYRDMLRELKGQRAGVIEVGYTDTNGWAR